MEKGIGVLLGKAGRKFSLSYGSSSDATSVLASYKNKEGEKIDLIAGLINLVSDEGDLDKNALGGLTTIHLYELQIRYDQFPNVDPKKPEKQYGIYGRVAWKPQINFWSDNPDSINVEATVDLRKLTGKKITGEICGMIKTPIEGLEFISMGACLRMVPEISNGVEIVQSKIFFLLQIGQVTFETYYDKNTSGDVNLEFRIQVDGKLTLGDVITFFASLVDPSIEEYEFNPPWDFLSKFDLSPLLNNLTLTFGFVKATKEKTFGFKLATPSGLIPNEIKPFLNVTSFGLSFSSKPKSQNSKKSVRKTKINITGTFVKNTYTDTNPLSWDPVDGKPPEIPGKGGAMFELRYLGLGQHVEFTQTASVESIKDVMNALRGTLESNQKKLVGDRALSMGSPQKSFLGNGSPIGFSADSEWLVGLDVTLLKMLNLSVIFNDPQIYGLRIELHGEAAKNFKGFVFEILYTKVSETTGKYHGELVLPDLLRRMEFGAVTVILPGIIVDIYTNGDFAVDLGFPRNFNYERSFALEVFPFTGAGGFYFRKLSAETATSTPRLHASDKGVFTPVYEIGVGLRVGLGKSFNKGPLKAEISITLQGMIEGVISWYRPANGGKETLFFRLSGGIRIEGRLYGAVDFVIISVEIEVLAAASIQFVMEVYKDIQVLLKAEVSVKATVKVAFIKVKKKFAMTVEQKFTIDSPTGYNTPWIVG